MRAKLYAKESRLTKGAMRARSDGNGSGISCPLAAPFTLTLALSHRGRGDLLCSALASGIVGEGSCRCRAHPPGIPRSFRFARSRPFRVTKGAFRLEAFAGGLDCFFDVLVGVG